MALYGFSDTDEKDMFRRLLSVTRVGPKLALAVLSILTPSDVAAAVVTDNAAAFDRVPGMGRKTAQRVLLELKERVGTSDMLAGDSNADRRTSARRRSRRWLSLGYDGLAAGKAVSAVQQADSVENADPAALARAGQISGPGRAFKFRQGLQMDERLIQLLDARDEAKTEYSLRPHYLDEYIGQHAVKSICAFISRRPKNAASRSTIRFFTARRDWARPRWPASLPTRWAFRSA
jgi:hypothetical protein